ncbi:2-amino-4-hydroxy-6-hydroxymethyldihydropteridine diphosphokinase [Paracidovorax cattleyae]|uniref:2-amino-4-hydroxy-6-hydroxymethyldihydropteridine pyrophosphokinase n=1 Tax=Paracidovorax cattleyae TaxID=80868 RepID=A0A1H0NL18_9BURK|nr:2-amino-4-hydroxy-6-hydroxymethyldihydropteridine diphosphokinase [Paracidovorax cattleyae]AVS75018.1 2-amino-4-hydroxy-6-hydroxymethyldihydropteridine diphosphokinase [Paracidovorax cattleyae]SDO93447.1 2-amino-4-hydroxy-6-hydroxymethyldihydropteridinediphosphokinase [Paracidovorax cattleyae]
MSGATVGASREPVLAGIGLGANLGYARAALAVAVAALAGLPSTQLQAVSSLYASAPVDATGPDYLNAVVLVVTRLTAPALLDALLAIEADAGRERPYRNAPRTLDLDLLFYGGARIASARLVVPHPRVDERAFVLRPLAEVAPHRVPAAALERVAGQRVEATAGPGWSGF